MAVIFDEANRMTAPVLEHWCKSPKFTRDLKNSWLLFTMNPGYAGRTELPSKSRLFLTSEMTIPPRDEIAAGRLAIAGAKNFRSLGQKIVQCNCVFEQTFNKNKWYDFGLRSLLAIVRLASSLYKRFPTSDEELLTAEAMKIIIVSRMEEAEKSKAIDVITSAFFGGNTAMQKLLNNFTTLNDKSLIKSDFADLFEIVQFRHGSAVIINDGQDDNQVAEAFIDAARQGQDANTWRMQMIHNPDLAFGVVNEDKSWTDGVLTTVFRKAIDASNADPTKMNYIVITGMRHTENPEKPFNSAIVEPLNTVLDDNKFLCLASNEILRLAPNTRVVFIMPTGVVSFASPAFVSRLGCTT